MKTKDWIANKINTKPTAAKWCSSVCQDTNGDFFSYGEHYPLLVNYKGKWILNNAGYSNTTSKHISYCYGLADYIIPFEPRTYWPSNEEAQKQYLIISLQHKIMATQEEIQTKKRHNTKIFKDLESQRNKLVTTLDEIIKL